MRIILFLLFLVCCGCNTTAEATYPYDAEISDITGLQFPLGWEPSKDASTFKQGVGIPRNFDWREKGLSPVENQGLCGSCWAMATTSVLEDNIKLSTGKDVDLSEQYLVDCAEEYWGCNGGFMAHDYHLNKGYQGAISEKDYPYVAREGYCKSGLQPIDKIVEWSEVNNSIEDLKYAIYNYGPIWTTVYVTNSLQNYRSGVFRQCQDGQSNHAVTLVGWNDDGHYWIMKNSWGPEWGESGYMRIPYNCNNIGYGSSYIVYKNKDPDPNPPNPDPDPDPGPGPNPPPPDPPEPQPKPEKKCRLESLIKSRPNGKEFILAINNNTRETLKIYWIDKKGKRVSYGTLKPGEWKNQRTYTYQGWVASDYEGECRGMHYSFFPSQNRWVVQ